MIDKDYGDCHTLYVMRDQFCDNRTLSRVSIQWGYGLDFDGDWGVSQFPGRVRDFGFACEDQDRGLEDWMPLEFLKRHKVPGETCIPVGTYPFARTWSDKFERRMMEVQNVPAFRGIRGHSGTDEFDTLGCVLFGLYRRDWRYVYKSTAACDWLDARFDDTEARGEKWRIVIARSGEPLAPLDVRPQLPDWSP